MNIKEKLLGVKENVLLKTHTTFKIGGPAKYFFIAKNKSDLVKAIKTAKYFKLPFFILGSGSNVLVSDDGYNGMIIKIQGLNIRAKANKIFAEAGMLLRKIVELTKKVELTGFEWAAGIPGTLGAAVYGNVGAFGSTMKNSVDSVIALDTKTLEIIKFTRKQCGFNNKESIFKKNKNLIILSVVLQLKAGDKKEIEAEVKRFVNYRKQNHPLNFPSAGCVFKNPEGFSAGKLIDKCGLRGKRIGDARVSEKHANFIINIGNAKAEDVLKLIKEIKKKVKEKFGIKLKEEIQYLK